MVRGGSQILASGDGPVVDSRWESGGSVSVYRVTHQLLGGL